MIISGPLLPRVGLRLDADRFCVGMQLRQPRAGEEEVCRYPPKPVIAQSDVQGPGHGTLHAPIREHDGANFNRINQRARTERLRSPRRRSRQDDGLQPPAN